MEFPILKLEFLTLIHFLEILTLYEISNFKTFKLEFSSLFLKFLIFGIHICKIHIKVGIFKLNLQNYNSRFKISNNNL